MATTGQKAAGAFIVLACCAFLAVSIWAVTSSWPAPPSPAARSPTCVSTGSPSASPAGSDCCSAKVDSSGNCLAATPSPSPTTTSHYMIEPYVKE